MKIIGMMPVYNDEDFIEEVIEHLISQEIPLVVLDNGSTDGTYEICEKFLGAGILELKQFKTNYYHWDEILRILYDMALVHAPDWVIRSDSDEFLESGIKNKTLRQAIEEVDKEGYNLIQFDRFEFFMTDDDKSAKSVKDSLRYYSYLGAHIYRAWKYFPGIRMGDTAGHYPVFPEGHRYKISPRKLVLRHYPFRNKVQAEKKIVDRTRGVDESERQTKLDPHVRNVIKYNYSSKIDPRLLTKYEQGGTWNCKKIFSPFGGKYDLKRKDVFNNNGSLKNKQKTSLEYRLELLEKQEQLSTLRRRQGYLYRTKRFGLNYLRALLGKKKLEI